MQHPSGDQRGTYRLRQTAVVTGEMVASAVIAVCEVNAVIGHIEVMTELIIGIVFNQSTQNGGSKHPLNILNIYSNGESVS